jgi:cyclopropane-fatty-acyl-phospholipid synthase
LGNLLSRIIRNGSLDVTTPSGATMRLGDGAGPRLAIRFTDTAAMWSLLLDPELTFGELYTDGRIVLERGSIYDLLAMVMRGAPGTRSLMRFHPLGLARDMAWRLQSGITPVHARQNVAHHYDLDGRLYSLFLDEDRQYSCAYFEQPDQSLDEAQAAKKRHIAAKLRLAPGNRVLDIGSGWGGLAVTLARAAPGVDVTGVTLSTEQHGY